MGRDGAGDEAGDGAVQETVSGNGAVPRSFLNSLRGAKDRMGLGMGPKINRLRGGRTC